MTEIEQAVIARGVLLKGLPFETTADDIKSFFKSLIVAHDNVRIIKCPDGSATGLAFVKLEDEEEIKRALLMDHNHMGSRYIEVKISDESEMYFLILRARTGATRNELYRISGHGGKERYPIYKQLETKFAYISGVPRGSQYKEIRTFFAGRLIGRGKIWLLRESGSGHFRGDGYIEFSNNEECLLALQNHGKMIGDSVVLVEPCPLEEAVEFSEGNLGGGGRDMDYRQGRTWRVEESWGGNRERERDHEYRQSGRRDRDHSKRTPSPARKRREVYAATYGRNTILRENDPYGETPYEQAPEGYPYDPLVEPNGGYSSHYANSSQPTAQYGGLLSGSSGGTTRIPTEASGSYRTRGRGPTVESFLSAAYGGHATVARQTSERSNLTPLFSSGGRAGGISRPLMGFHGQDGLGAGYQEKKVLRVEGLPYDVTVPQILDFFHGYELSYDNVRIQCRDDGSPSGKAFVTFLSERYARLALQQLNKRYINDRYVELFLV